MSLTSVIGNYVGNVDRITLSNISRSTSPDLRNILNSGFVERMASNPEEYIKIILATPTPEENELANMLKKRGISDQNIIIGLLINDYINTRNFCVKNNITGSDFNRVVQLKAASERRKATRNFSKYD